MGLQPEESGSRQLARWCFPLVLWPAQPQQKFMSVEAQKGTLIQGYSRFCWPVHNEEERRKEMQTVLCLRGTKPLGTPQRMVSKFVQFGSFQKVDVSFRYISKLRRKEPSLLVLHLVKYNKSEKVKQHTRNKPFSLFA